MAFMLNERGVSNTNAYLGLGASEGRYEGLAAWRNLDMGVQKKIKKSIS